MSAGTISVCVVAPSPRDVGPGCDATMHGFQDGVSEAVAVFCEYGPGQFRVTAHCSDGQTVWFAVGFPGIPGESPSVVRCEGTALLPVHVLDRSIEWF